MPRVEITTQTTLRAGLEATYGSFDATDGNYFDNSNQDVILHVKNAHATLARVLHFPTPKTQDSELTLGTQDLVVSVSALTDLFLGPFQNSEFGSSGLVNVDSYNESGPTFSATTGQHSGGVRSTDSLTVAAIKVGTLG